MKIVYMANEDMRKKGAGKTHFMEVAWNLTKMGNELVILLPGYWPLDKKDYEVRIYYVPTLPKNIFSYLVYEILRPFVFLFLILKFKPNVVYARQDLFDVIPPVLAKLFKIPYVIEKNGLVEADYQSRGKSGLVIKILMFAECFNARLAKKIICVTEGIQREISSRYGISKNKFVVIPNGANTELFRIMDTKVCRRRLGLSEDSFYVGFVGSFAPWQGLTLLVEAAKVIKDTGYTRIKFLLVGDGEQEKKLRQKVLDYDLGDTVFFAGRVEYREVVFWINAFDVAVAPFSGVRNKTCGLSPIKLYEYLACGKPVIAADIEGVREIVEENECGYLFEAGDKLQLVDKILFCYRNRNMLNKVALHCRDVIREGYSWEQTARKVVQVLKDLLSESNDGMFHASNKNENPGASSKG